MERIVTINKRRERAEYSFANINLLGKCNAKCYFCLGEDIPELLRKHNNIKQHFLDWPNFDRFITRCDQLNINKIYLTGQNTDSLLYKYRYELLTYLKNYGFTVGLRTNGYLAHKNINLLNMCENSVGLSIHSLNSDVNYQIMQRYDIPNWDILIPQIINPRVAIVVNRYNKNEFFNILQYLSKFKNIKYVQARRISTDTRYEMFKEDLAVYEDLYDQVQVNWKDHYLGDFYHAQQYNMYGLQVNFWRTVQTSVNSINYFSDGTLSDNYFVVEGYKQNYNK
jgi:MoaA/NifB/PqqE/SkfB family radical SAM enzyme